MKRIILFRFHDHFDICKNRIAILRHFNPGTPIYGLYGGTESNYAKAQLLPLESTFMIPIDDPYWKWLNGDLAARWWFKEFGHTIPFDMVHIIEWDLVLLEPIEKAFEHITDGIAITARQKMKPIYNTWTWVKPGRGREEWIELSKRVQKKFGRLAPALAGIFPGAAMSRAFLGRYAKEEIGSLCNDEVRLPLFAQAYGMAVHDTKLKNKFFNAEDRTIRPATVYTHYKKGIRAFHPVKEQIELKKCI